jgi:ABC-type branched-subunit amino acid transport system ATPase component
MAQNGSAVERMLAITQLHSGYGKAEVVHGIDFGVGKGEIVTILGPNGCGKTTFIKTIMGFVRATRGSIFFDGQEISALSASERAMRGVGYVPQLLNVFKPLSVLENLELGGYRLSANQRKDALHRVLELFPKLGQRRRQLAGTLSGGERQLLALGRSLMSSPRLLLLDEPSAGLSPIRADEVFSHIRSVADTGIAIVIVEQDIRRALFISTRACVLVTGRLAFEGLSSTILRDKRIHDAYLGRVGTVGFAVPG